MVLPAATPRRTSSAVSVAPAAHESDAASDAESNTKGATSPSSTGRKDAVIAPSGPGDTVELAPFTSIVPVAVVPTPPPTVQRSPIRRSMDAMTAYFANDASTLLPPDENTSLVSE